VNVAARHQLLLEIRQHWEEGRGGKVIQRLLELAFHEAGYRLIEERMSEGIDFDVEEREGARQRYSFEARTTTNATVCIKDEDLRQMDLRIRDGCQAGIAALRICPGGCWVFVQRSWLLPSPLRISIGTSPSWTSLADQINEEFDSVLERFGAIARDKGLDGLASHLNLARY
jgi:hypothetical protein